MPCTGVPAGSAVDSADILTGRAVEWLEIHADGAEGARRGRVWAPAPALGGMAAWWVVPNIAFPRRLTAPGGSLLAVRASRRHQVGRRTPEGRWKPQGGRYVDVGTLYVHTDPASPQGAVLARARAHPGPPRAIKVRPLPLPILRAMSGWYQEHGVGVLAEYEQG